MDTKSSDAVIKEAEEQLGRKFKRGAFELKGNSLEDLYQKIKDDEPQIITIKGGDNIER